MKADIEDFKKMLASRMDEISCSCLPRVRGWFYGIASGSGIDAHFVSVNEDRSEIVFEFKGQRHSASRKG